MKNLLQRIRIFQNLAGSTIQIWLLGGVVSGFGLTVVELLLSIQVANLMSVLGITDQKLSLPFDLAIIPATPVAYLITFICLGLLRGVFFFILSHSGNLAHESLAQRLRLIAFYENFGPKGRMLSLTSLMSKLSEHFMKATMFALNLVNFVPILLQVIFLCALLIHRSILLSSIAFFCVGVVGVVIHFLNIYVRRIVASFPTLVESVIQRTLRMGRNWYLLKALRMMEGEYQKLIISSTRLTNSVIRSNSLGNFSALLPQVLGILTVIALVMIQIKNQPLIGVAFLSFLYLFLRLVQTLSSLATAYGNLNAYSQSYFLIENYVGQFSKEDLTEALKPADLVSSVGLRRKLHFFEQTASKESHAKSSRALPQRPPQIQFVDVDFRYSSDGPWILRNFNLVIQSGEACAIMGASGSGKSTLLALVLGLLEPTGGKVLIDEMEPKIYFSKYSQTLGFVGSEPYIVEGTVRENLQYGSSNFAATDDELLQSLKRAQLQDLLDQNSKILDYPLTENGEGLSTGQKQRLMFARGMLAHPKLLLLDEASANLDELTESALTNEIKKLYGQCTVLAISHRPAFVNWMNHIQRLNTESSSRGLSL